MYLSLLFAAALLPSVARSLSFPSHFASSMVLQRDKPIAFWGIDSPGADVDVTYRGSHLPRATADATGRFSVTLPALPVNATPDSITVRSSSGAAAVLSDVLLGDVVVCSG